MYEDEKGSWQDYKKRLITLGIAWLFLIAMTYTKHLDMNQALIGGVFFSLAIMWIGAQQIEFRYENLSQIFCDNGRHFSFHPDCVHHKGRYHIVAVGGFSTSGMEWKSGEGTLIFPSALLEKPSSNPPKVLHLRTAPVQCSEDALPQEVRSYILRSGFGFFKKPYYFTITPSVDGSGDEDLKQAILDLSKNEGEMKDLNMQVAKQEKVIQSLLDLHADVRDALKPKWYHKVFGRKETKEED